MIRQRLVIFPLIICGLTAMLSGCFGTSPPTRFYTLSPSEKLGGSSAPGLETVVTVGPIQIPGYLDRRQIVTRSGQNGIVLAEFDQWGSPFSGEIMNSLVDGLSARMAPARVVVLPWRSTSPAGLRTAYRIPVIIARFDGTRGGTVVLNATWTVLKEQDGGEKRLFARESTITEEVKGKDYDALVAAMSRAVGKLAGEIADRVAPIVSENEPGRKKH
jgi:uncharacterized lipoprotein YmbA